MLSGLTQELVRAQTRQVAAEAERAPLRREASLAKRPGRLSRLTAASLRRVAERLESGGGPCAGTGETPQWRMARGG
jgi:hypothetical protein